MSVAAAAAPGPAIGQAGEERSRRIESLRAIAAHGVILTHALAYAYGAREVYDGFAHRAVTVSGVQGLYVFFALSGYLMFWPFVRRDFGAGEPVSLRRYARNRVLRVVPMYYVTLAALLLTGLWMGPTGEAWRFFLFAENFSRSTVEVGDGSVWSMVVEVEFYLLLPVLAWGVARLAGGSKRRAAGMLIGLAALSLGFHLYLGHLDTPEPLWGDSLLPTFFLFVVGMLLALVRMEWRRGVPAWTRRPGASDALVLLAAVLFGVFAWRFLVPESVLAGVAATMLLVGVTTLPVRGGLFVRLLDWRPLAVLGTATYSFYLVHLPIVARVSQHVGSPTTGGFIALLAATIPLCWAVALVCYVLVERTFLRLRVRWFAASPVAQPAGVRRSLPTR